MRGFEATMGVDDLDATVAAVEAGGGKVVMQPSRIEGVGRGGPSAWILAPPWSYGASMRSMIWCRSAPAQLLSTSVAATPRRPCVV